MKKRVRFAENAVVVNSQRTLTLTTETDESSVYENYPIACFLTSGKMHGLLSNTWDEYKIESVELSITPAGTEQVIKEDEETIYFKLFTCIDNNRPPVNISYSQIKTNNTYKETSFAFTASNKAGKHNITFPLQQLNPG